MEKMLLGVIQLVGIKHKVRKMKDPMSVAMLAGLFGTIAMDIVNLLLFLTKRSENLLSHIGVSMIVSKFRTTQSKNIILGQIWHLITGIVFAMPMMSLFRTSGANNHRVKGAFIGALSWGILYNLGTRLRFYSASPHLTKTHYSYLVTDIIYGIVTAEAIKIFADPKLFKNTDIEEERMQKIKEVEQEAKNNFAVDEANDFKLAAK